MVTAWSGKPSRSPTAAIVAALSVCSGVTSKAPEAVSVVVVPPLLTEATTHPGDTLPGRWLTHHTTTPVSTTSTASSTMPRPAPRTC